MRRILALTGMTCVLLSFACTSTQFWSVQTPEQAKERARVLRAEAGGFRKEARAHELLIQQKESDVEKHRAMIEKLEATRSELEEQIVSLSSKRRDAAGETALGMDKVIEKYRDDKGVVQSQIEARIVTVTTLEQQIQQWRDYRAALLRWAEEREEEAAGLDEYAVELAEQ